MLKAKIWVECEYIVQNFQEVSINITIQIQIPG